MATPAIHLQKLTRRYVENQLADREWAREIRQRAMGLTCSECRYFDRGYICTREGAIGLASDKGMVTSGTAPACRFWVPEVQG